MDGRTNKTDIIDPSIYNRGPIIIMILILIMIIIILIIIILNIK